MASSSRRDDPWLSVIMPSHRGERWIGEALSSVAAEASDGIEILLIDSSPTSASTEVAQRFADRLNLRLFNRPDLAQWHAKTNFGVKIARADHVCWLHVDDVWLPGRATAVRRWIGAAPEVHLHLAPTTIIDRSGRILGKWRCPLPASAELPTSLLTERLLVQNFIAAPAPVFRRDAWMTCGGLDESLWYTADWDIWLKLAFGGPASYHDEATTGFRIHDGSQTATGSRNIEEFANQMQEVLDRHLARLTDPSASVARTARASIAVNAALAAAAAGGFRGIFPAAIAVLRLGPAGIHRYFRDSRIIDRLAPRLRAMIAGTYRA